MFNKFSIIKILGPKFFLKKYFGTKKLGMLFKIISNFAKIFQKLINE